MKGEVQRDRHGQNDDRTGDQYVPASVVVWPGSWFRDGPCPERFRVSLQPLQVGANFGRVLVAEVSIIFEAPIDDAHQLRGHIGVGARGCHMTAVVLATGRVRRHFMEHDAKREEVRPVVQRFGADLLRRHVRRRSHHTAYARQVGLDGARRFRHHSSVGVISSDGGDLRQSEVEDLRGPSRRDEDVGWFDVAVDNAFGMRGIERLGDLDPEADDLIHS